MTTQVRNESSLALTCQREHREVEQTEILKGAAVDRIGGRQDAV